MAIKQYLRAVLERFMSEEELKNLDAQYELHKTNQRPRLDKPVTPEEEKIAELWRTSTLNINAFAKALGLTRDRVTTILIRVDRARHRAGK